MKRKFLALVFVAAMTMGLAKTAGSNDWPCETISYECSPGSGQGFTAMVCGSELERLDQISMYWWHYCSGIYELRPCCD
ncbi:MAG: hypothetical protein K0B09_11995 [Bacteroidales bacterium]|nr:hypothetical protein [Bacteroidales bacterium]